MYYQVVREQVWRLLGALLVLGWGLGVGALWAGETPAVDETKVTARRASR